MYDDDEEVAIIIPVGVTEHPLSFLTPDAMAALQSRFDCADEECGGSWTNVVASIDWTAEGKPVLRLGWFEHWALNAAQILNGEAPTAPQSGVGEA